MKTSKGKVTADMIYILCANCAKARDGKIDLTLPERSGNACETCGKPAVGVWRESGNGETNE